MGIGHPQGLPRQYTGEAQVQQVARPGTPAFRFATNLDAFVGSSGSGVFETERREMVGIIVSGQRDYDDKGCLIRYPQEQGREWASGAQNLIIYSSARPSPPQPPPRLSPPPSPSPSPSAPEQDKPQGSAPIATVAGPIAGFLVLAACVAIGVLRRGLLCAHTIKVQRRTPSVTPCASAATTPSSLSPRDDAGVGVAGV